jgi:hypothetical protein
MFVASLRRNVVLSFLFLVQSALAKIAPECIGEEGQAIPIDNSTPISWKIKEANGWQTRSHIDGYFVAVTNDGNSHFKFTIQIGPDKNDLIEVVYNKEFGQYPAVFPGMKVEACGDFINAFAQFGRYPPSPAGAIIHWVHKNPKYSPGKHEHGYLVMDQVLVGYQNPKQQSN